MPRTPHLALFACCCVFASSKAAAETNPRPNVLSIAVDDLNDWVCCLGGYPGEVHTPNIDRLASKGLLFENAHCPAPVCNPSRTAILTGLRPSTTGIYDNGRWWRPALPGVTTLPEFFRQQGYEVAGGGKIFRHTPGFNPPEQWDQYFRQVFDDPWHRAKPGDALPVQGLDWPRGFPLSGLDNVRTGKRPPANPREFDWGPFTKPDNEMGDGQMVEWAKTFLAKKHKRPFFLAAGIFRPHLPWYVPRKYFELYPLEKVKLPKVPEDDLEDIPNAGRKMANYRGDEWEYLKQERRWREAVQAYLASISFADALVGELMAALEKSPHAKDTIIVLWSDHGWHLGEKHHWHKFTLWEEATRVPLIIAAPKITSPGTKTARPVGLIDLYPTLAELCGLSIPQNLDGISLVPLLRDPTLEWKRPALTTHGRGNHALRTERFRYIRYADDSEEMYDHTADPNEWKNVAGESQVKELKQRLQKWFPETDAEPALNKNAYRFDPIQYRWTRQRKTPY